MRFASLLLAAACLGSPALAGQYAFTPAPQTDLNRIYRVDRQSGEVTACQYGLKEGSIGVTLCYGAGEGAGAQPTGDYALVASRHEREGGVFRVNHRSGHISVCYVFNDSVVCTPQERAQAAAAASASVQADAAATVGASPSAQAPKRH